MNFTLEDVMGAAKRKPQSNYLQEAMARAAAMGPQAGQNPTTPGQPGYATAPSPPQGAQIPQLTPEAMEAMMRQLLGSGRDPR